MPSSSKCSGFKFPRINPYDPKIIRVNGFRSHLFLPEHNIVVLFYEPPNYGKLFTFRSPSGPGMIVAATTKFRRAVKARFPKVKIENTKCSHTQSSHVYFKFQSETDILLFYMEFVAN